MVTPREVMEAASVTEPEEGLMFRTILWASDASRASEHALPFVKRLVRNCGARLVVVHATRAGALHDGPQKVSIEDVEVEGALRKLVKAIRSEGIDAEFRVAGPSVSGPARAIADCAAAIPADLIVVGTRGLPAISAILRGGLTPRLLAIAPCPVVSVPLGAGSPVQPETTVAHRAAA
jgi:nucleotide-binding universal stress UspA family protein